MDNLLGSWFTSEGYLSITDTPGVWFVTIICNEHRGRGSCRKHCRGDGKEPGLLQAAVPVPVPCWCLRWVGIQGQHPQPPESCRKS